MGRVRIYRRMYEGFRENLNYDECQSIGKSYLEVLYPSKPNIIFEVNTSPTHVDPETQNSKGIKYNPF